MIDKIISFLNKNKIKALILVIVLTAFAWIIYNIFFQPIQLSTTGYNIDPQQEATNQEIYDYNNNFFKVGTIKKEDLYDQKGNKKYTITIERLKNSQLEGFPHYSFIDNNTVILIYSDGIQLYEKKPKAFTLIEKFKSYTSELNFLTLNDLKSDNNYIYTSGIIGNSANKYNIISKFDYEQNKANYLANNNKILLLFDKNDLASASYKKYIYTNIFTKNFLNKIDFDDNELSFIDSKDVKPICSKNKFFKQFINKNKILKQFINKNKILKQFINKNKISNFVKLKNGDLLMLKNLINNKEETVDPEISFYLYKNKFNKIQFIAKTNFLSQEDNYSLSVIQLNDGKLFFYSYLYYDQFAYILDLKRKRINLIANNSFLAVKEWFYTRFTIQLLSRVLKLSNDRIFAYPNPSFIYDNKSKKIILVDLIRNSAYPIKIGKDQFLLDGSGVLSYKKSIAPNEISLFTIKEGE